MHTGSKEEDEELAIFLAMEKEVIGQELKNKGISEITQVERSLSGINAKAEQNMENLVCSQILSMNQGKVNQTGGDTEEVKEDEDREVDEDEVNPLRKR